MTSLLQVAKPTCAPLRPAGAADDGAPLPLTVTTRVAIAGRAVSFDDINARLGGTTLRGQSRRRCGATSGALEADAIDAAR